MPYNIHWYDEDKKTIIYLEYDGMLKLQDFVEYNNDIIRLMNESPHTTVHVLAETSGIKGVVPQAIDIRNVLSYVKEEKLGWIIICGANVFVRFLSALVFQMTRSRVHFHNTVDEALEFLADLDATEAAYRVSKPSNS